MNGTAGTPPAEMTCGVVGGGAVDAVVLVADVGGGAVDAVVLVADDWVPFEDVLVAAWNTTITTTAPTASNPSNVWVLGSIRVPGLLVALLVA